MDTIQTAAGAGTADMAVSEQVMEALLTELCVYAAKSCLAVSTTTATTTEGTGGTNDTGTSGNTAGVQEEEEAITVAAEMAAAKLERMGYATGYRLCERLAQNKTWNVAAANQDPAAATAAQQLEAVKFLCKEVWMQVFNKQIDKLQTNHRGVFVLRDLELTWLTRFPVQTEQSRVTAIRYLAFPCGIVRGCLANLGIPSVVSCDFLADGATMAACSFNIKVK
jgi:hypothetical protein